MDTWLGVVKDFGGVILGWVLGLGSALIVDKVKGREKREVVQRGILTELREVAHRLLFVVFLTKRRHRKMDRNLLEWMQTQIDKYAGPNPKDGVLASVKGLLLQTDADLGKFAALEKATSATGLFQLSVETPYASTAILQADYLDSLFSQRVLDILAHIRMFNEIRENLLFYQRLTFESRLGDENYKTVLQNAVVTEDQLSERARIVIEKISALEEQFKKQRFAWVSAWFRHRQSRL